MPTDMKDVKESTSIFSVKGSVYFVYENSIEKYTVKSNQIESIVSSKRMIRPILF